MNWPRSGKPILLDLFCGAGGAAMGYHRAGFEVIGVDLNPMPRYPFMFVQANALNVLDTLILGGTTNDARLDDVIDWGYRRASFAAVHASPPCQRFSSISRCRPGLAEKYPNLIGPVRERLQVIDLPYIIENVPGAPLIEPVTLCGSQFNRCVTWPPHGDLMLRRHRNFEANFSIADAGAHDHSLLSMPVMGHGEPPGRRSRLKASGRPTTCCGYLKAASEVMGIDWMNRDEIAESIPPDYTEYIGGQLMQYIKTQMVLAA